MPRHTAGTITDRELTDLYDERDRLAAGPLLRNCLMPGCLRQIHIASHLAGDPPPRPEWAGHGWRSLRSGTIVVAGGFICPDHADLIGAHLPARIVQDQPQRVAARCSCGAWISQFVRWHGAARGLWEDHLLTIAAEKPGRD